MTVKLTPMMQQYMDCKERYPDAVLFFRLGDFYEMFFEDAQVVSRELGLTLTSRSKDDEIPMAGVPHHAAQGYIAQLIEKGFTVAVAEQLEDPNEVKGMVQRDVVRVITPGVVLDTESLEAKAANYVAAIDTLGAGLGASSFGLAFLDISTGDFRATEVATINDLISELHRIEARELLVPEYASALVDVIKEQLSHVFIRQKHHEYYNPEGLLKNIDKGPRKAGHHEAESYFLDRAGVIRVLAPLGLMSFVTPELVESAASAVLRYIVKAQRGIPAHVRPINPYRAQAFLVVDESTKANLELTETLMGGKKKGSLLSVIDHTVTAMGGRRLRQWLGYPLIEVEQIVARLDAVEELVKFPALRDDVRSLLDEVYDIERLCGRISAGSANARDMRSLLGTLEVIPQIKDALAEASSDLLHEIEDQLDPCEELCALIDRAIVESPPVSLSEGGIFKLGYHEELDEILELSNTGKDWMLSYEQEEREATGINSLKVKYNRVFGYFIEVTKANIKSVPDRYMRKQTTSNAERYFTSELKEMEEKVLHAEERRSSLEQELFEQLRRIIADELERLMRTASELANLDVISSMAELAIKRDYCRPTLSEDGTIEIDDGRHPVVEVSLEAGQRFVPNSVRLDDQRKLAIITGPNMAGKSTIIRQVALISLMAQMGSFVPAKSASLGVVDKIFSRVGASDNLAKGQSTFMVEMTETAHILSNATSRSLVILDEIGRGTATYDGLSIAWAVAEHLHNTLQVKTLFATHYHELTELADDLPSAFNMSIAVKEFEGNIIFLRKLVERPANRSYGIEVGRLAGLPEPVVARAKSVLVILEDGHFEQLKAKMPDGSEPIRRHTEPEPLHVDVDMSDHDAAFIISAPTPQAQAAPVQPAPSPAEAPVKSEPVEATPVVVQPQAPQPQAAAAQAQPQPQLSLFAPARSALEDEVLGQLKTLAVGHLTPIQALILLDELSRKLIQQR